MATPRAHARAEEGAAAVEWAGVLAVTALVVGALLASSIGQTLRTDVTATICAILGGADCGGAATDGSSGEPPNQQLTWEEQPDRLCTLAERGGSQASTVTIGVVDLGGGQGYLKEERADGTVALTTFASSELGVSTGVGASAGAEAGPLDLEAAVEASAGAAAFRESGRMVVFDDTAHFEDWLAYETYYDLPGPPTAASSSYAITQWIRDKATGARGEKPPEPEIERVYSEDGIRFETEASGGAGPFKAELDAMASAAKRRELDPRDGTYTIVLELDSEMAATFGWPELAGLTASGDSTVEAAVTVAADGTPEQVRFDTGVQTAGGVNLGGSADDVDSLLGAVNEVAVEGDAQATTGVDVGLTLDLDTDRDRSAAMRALTATAIGSDDDPQGLAEDTTVTDATAHLVNRMHNDAEATVLTHEGSESSFSLGAEIRKGIGLGGELEAGSHKSSVTSAHYLSDAGELVEWTDCFRGTESAAR